MSDTAKPPHRLSTGVCIGYGTGTIGVSIMLNAVTTYYPVLMTTVLGQSPQLAGLLMMLSKLYDAVMDVVIGSVSDRTRSRWGRRRPYLLAGAFVSAASFFLIFSPPSLGNRALVAYMMGALILYSTGYALFNVPYVAMASEMTSDFHERTRLWSFRTFFVSIGQLLSLAGTATLIAFGGGGSHGYGVMGLVLALVILTAMVSSFFGTGNAERIERSTAPPARLSAQLRSVWGNRHFVLLMGAKVFQFLAFASSSGTVVLFMLNVLKLDYSGPRDFSIASNVTVAVAMPLWVRIARKLGKKNAYLLGVGIYMTVMLSWVLADSRISETELLIRGVSSGFGSASLILLSMSMLSDTMAYDRYTSGLHREGLYSSIVAILEKTGSAIGVVLIGSFLAWAHYIPTKNGALVVQPASAIWALYGGIAVIPAIFFIGNILCIVWYGLDAATMKKTANERAAKTA
jgi:GPH family glycoside/pentoside/hexuronide:cation symporter